MLETVRDLTGACGPGETHVAEGVSASLHCEKLGPNRKPEISLGMAFAPGQRLRVSIAVQEQVMADCRMPEEFYDEVAAHHLPPDEPVGPQGGRPRIKNRVVMKW